MNSTQDLIRNFCIIAHIDHGKSTLADRLLELTETVTKREMKEQLLDQMDLEREKGITIKLAPVRMGYKLDGVQYQLNLIDTPGHVDFSYEVSRSLQACEGALLVVDASQGIQAQTLANVYLALEQDLTIIPVMNKIDLPAADVDRVGDEIVKLLGCKREDILQVSAKTGMGVDQVLEHIVKDIPAPKGKVFVNSERGQDTDVVQGGSEARKEAYKNVRRVSTGTANEAMHREFRQVAGSARKQDEMVLAPLRCLIFDSVYDEYRGVILYVRVVDGQLKKSENIKLMATQTEGIALEIGALKPMMTPLPQLDTGEIGYIVTNLKSVAEAKVGDTVTSAKEPASLGLPGYREVKPFVYAGIFPNSSDDYPLLKDALEKLTLSDSALRYTPENSSVLGHGFRIGFLGLLHLEIVKERLERTHNTEVVVTNPSTDYQIKLMSGEELTIKSAAELPNVTQIAEIREPWIKGEIVVPKEYLGGVLQLIVAGRGMQKNLSYLDEQLALISFEAPLANMLTDFYDQLKSITSGYGSFSYELDNYRDEELVKLDFLVANERVDSLSLMVHRSEALKLGREIVAKLKDIIPRQLFEVSLQAAVGGKIIAREDVKALGKNVTGHLYGGDVSRKKKLWAKQKAGKARMKKFGKVEIPNEAFTVLLKKD